MKSRIPNALHRRGLLRFLLVATLIATIPSSGLVGGDETSDETESVPVGGTLRVVMPFDVDSMDPRIMYFVFSWTIARGTTRTLVTASGEPGRTAELDPDLATNLGTAEENATIWTYKIKDNVKFGPPARGHVTPPGIVGREITCSDVKYGIESGYLKAVNRPYNVYYDVLKGVAEFISGTANEISGIVCEDEKTIRFELTEPTGDWPYRLALPGASPVPRRWAERFDQGKSNYGQHALATGPYYVATWEKRRRIVLRRNPYWDPATDKVRHAYVDEVEIKIDPDEDRGVQGIIDGIYDYGFVIPRGAKLEQILNDPELAARFINEPILGVRYMALNTTVPPLDSLLVRQAINWGIDRAAVLEAFGGAVAGEIAPSILPPGAGGFLADFNPFASPEMKGDAAMARALMNEAGYPNGWDGALEIVVANHPILAAAANVVLENLKEIGFNNAKLTLVQDIPTMFSLYSMPTSGIAFMPGPGWVLDYPDASGLMLPLFRVVTETNNQNFSQLQDPVLNQLIDSAQETPLGEQRSLLWEQANMRATEVAAWVPFFWIKGRIFYGPRIVNPTLNTFLSHLDWVNMGLSEQEQG